MLSISEIIVIVGGILTFIINIGVIVGVYVKLKEDLKEVKTDIRWLKKLSAPTFSELRQVK